MRPIFQYVLLVMECVALAQASDLEYRVRRAGAGDLARRATHGVENVAAKVRDEVAPSEAERAELESRHNSNKQGAVDAGSNAGGGLLVTLFGGGAGGGGGGGAGGLAQQLASIAEALGTSQEELKAAMNKAGKNHAGQAQAGKATTVTKTVEETPAPMNQTVAVASAAPAAAQTGGQFSFLTTTVFASGTAPAVTFTPLPLTITQTVLVTMCPPGAAPPAVASAPPNVPPPAAANTPPNVPPPPPPPPPAAVVPTPAAATPLAATAPLESTLNLGTLGAKKTPAPAAVNPAAVAAVTGEPNIDTDRLKLESAWSLGNLLRMTMQPV
ncbi:unnamed protein product [Discula destructiva]